MISSGLHVLKIPLLTYCNIFPKQRNQQRLLTRPRAASSDEDKSASAATTEAPAVRDFEERFTRWRVGKGKKAELKRLRKAGMDPSKLKSKQKGIFLPPVPLKDPISGGLKVELGFNPYSERLNGRIAALGLAALLLVELGSGQSLIKYHAPATILIQSYFIFAVSAIYLKYEKEKISIWPKSKSKV
eukprot:TRINITY_DN4934_c0_g1_i1.p1 TRINITY_DN4934_c0_g1~~TRINITY_DN4934_c0_g1_i1.p1  ORF type:complete len:187 (+),score=33.20 TRINITY_DN4934_c0_g1_i1:160-720(+)